MIEIATLFSIRDVFFWTPMDSHKREEASIILFGNS